jgi:t-SNARE complex subunit (syntaxin)
MGLAEQKNVLSDITSDIMHIKSALETIKKDQAKQNSASEDMMAAIKENAENIESKHKLVFAMFFLIVIVILVLALMLKPSLH